MVLAADVVVLGLRALSFVAIFQAAGAAIFLVIFARDLTVARERVLSVARRATYAAATLTVLYHVLLPARMAGSFAGTFDPALESLLLSSSAGIANVVRLVGLGLLAVAWEAPARIGRLGGVVGSALVLGSFALTGHTTIHDERWLLAPLLLAHVAIVAFWFGGLVPLYEIAQREPAAVAGRVAARFSRIATIAVPVILAAGALMGVLFIRSTAELFTGYGALVIGKTAAFAALLWLASRNRFRFVPMMAASAGAMTASGSASRATSLPASRDEGEYARGAAGLRRTIVAEWAIIALVLGATALMTSLYSPLNLHAAFGEGH